VFFLFLNDGTWGWIAAFFYVSSTVVRLARFNVEQAGHAKVAFHGLPSPSAGMTLATFYPFSQTAIFQTYFAAWRWPELMIGLMIVLGFLMMSHVLYPVVPKVGFRSARGLLTGLFLLSCVLAGILIPSLFFFPALIGYVSYGVLKSLAIGFFERMPDDDPMLDEPGDEAGAELRDIDYRELSPWQRFRKQRQLRRYDDIHDQEDTL
jgi:CDP-diacylglycerol---serine O-phosphatidyltransferase